MLQYDLSGEIAAVTGACGKLGPVWVSALASAGAGVLAIDLPTGTPTDGWKALLDSDLAERIRFVPGDAVDRSSAEAALSECLATLGAPSILVNNAGIDTPPGVGPPTPIEDISASEFDRVLTVNVTSVLVMSQVFGTAMREAGRGSIVNIGSLYASVSPDARFYDHISSDPPFVKPPAYGASKAALVNLTRYLATHWAAAGIRVNSLSPGGVAGGQDAQFIEKFTARVPLGRMATDDDLVGPLLFLASDASRYVTGIDLRVDGGFTAW